MSYPWLNGWTTGAPVELGYSYVPRDAWSVAEGIRTHLDFRDSRLAEATGGVLGAQYVRHVGADVGDHGWHAHDLDWQFFYVLAGSMKHQTDEEGERTLRPGDAGCYPGFMWHREWGFSDDCELIALRAPATTTTYTGRETELPERAATMDPTRAPFYSFEGLDAWTGDAVGQFEVRGLPSSGPSGGRIGMRLVRAAREGASVDWHHSTAGKWLVVLGGSAVVEVRGRSPFELGFLDVLSFGPGPELARRVLSCSADYKVLELQIPASG